MKLFPGLLDDSEAQEQAAAINAAAWHYRIVDIKFTTIELLAGGGLGNSGSKLAYKGQLHIHNRALGRIEGYLPRTAYLLGRAGLKHLKEVTYRGTSCMECLGPVVHESDVAGEPLGSLADQGVFVDQNHSSKRRKLDRTARAEQARVATQHGQR